MTLLLVIAIVLALNIIFGIIYLITGIGKRFYHDILEWHRPDNTESFDGCSRHSVCKYCGKNIMQDSQGNWF